MNIDLNAQPPSAHQLAESRAEAAEIRRRCERRKRWGVAIVVAASFIVIVAASFIVPFDASFKLWVRTPTEVLNASDNLGITLLGIGLFIMFTLIALEYLAYLYDRFIDTPLRHANERLAGLVELNAISQPDTCLEYMSLVDREETVRAYQRQIAVMGRMPVVAEYEAVKAWVEANKNHRAEYELKERAKQACEQMRAFA